MCVNDRRSTLLARSSFLGAVSAAALPLFASPERALAAVGERAPSAAPLKAPASAFTSAANARGAMLADTPFGRAQFVAIGQLASSIGDRRLREDALDLLHHPVPAYMKRYPTHESRVELRDRMAAAGFVSHDAPIQGIFPPVGPDGLAQPFWSTPGSDTNGHHAYPGGLCGHELFNASMGEQFAQTYDRLYFSGRPRVERDLAIAAALYHDIMKTVVFQYNEDGTLFKELSIGATGGHHCLSGATAILRGRDARFVTVLLSAHAAPSLGDEAKVVTWCRAAAMIAGVDPVEYGLVRKTSDGYTLADRPAVECFVNHLSDHDYVLTIHAMHDVRPMLAHVAPTFGIPASGAELNWWRLRVLSIVPAVTLYHELLQGEDAFVAAVRRAVA